MIELPRELAGLSLMRHSLVPHVIAVVALVVAALGAGVSLGQASTTTASAANYEYDHLGVSTQGSTDQALHAASPKPLRPGVQVSSGAGRLASGVGAATESATGVASGLGGETGSMSIVSTVGPGEKVADLLNEGRTLANEGDAEFFAARRAPGGVLQYGLSPRAVSALQDEGAVFRPIPGGPSSPSFAGQEFFVPSSAFGPFNSLREAGEIVVRPR